MLGLGSNPPDVFGSLSIHGLHHKHDATAGLSLCTQRHGKPTPTPRRALAAVGQRAGRRGCTVNLFGEPAPATQTSRTLLCPRAQAHE